MNKLFPIVVAACCAASLTAQHIQWGAPIPTIAASDVSTNGTLVVARNLHSAGATVSPTVNGVTFVGKSEDDARDALSYYRWSQSVNTLVPSVLAVRD